jgi:hypothetical protein
MVGRFFIVYNDYNRSGVAEFPHVGVFVDLFPGEAAVSGKEDVRVGIRGELFADITDSEH